MSMLAPAWPPTASRSTTMVRSPSDAAYTAAASPPGPAPTIRTSHVSLLDRRRTERVRDLGVRWVDQRATVRQ